MEALTLGKLQIGDPVFRELAKVSALAPSDTNFSRNKFD
jgi:hypothetical protein